MNYGEFTRRFREGQEIGREIRDDRLDIYRANGTEVGVWREDPRSTFGRGEVLGRDDASMARYWFGRRGTPPGRS